MTFTYRVTPCVRIELVGTVPLVDWLYQQNLWFCLLSHFNSLVVLAADAPRVIEWLKAQGASEVRE